MDKASPYMCTYTVYAIGLALNTTTYVYMYIYNVDQSFSPPQAGSSSPVSSISGFSTNSHLEDGTEDNTQSSSSLAAAASSTSGGGGAGGVARDDKKNDPFAGGGSDLFSAFSAPGSSNDPFFSAGGGANLFSGKPSDLSAFDPFGISDPFKVSLSYLCG